MDERGVGAMGNLSVRRSLLAVLAVFAAMMVLGGVLGVVALSRANAAAALQQEIASQVILVNDGYKDTTRTRSALTRAYAALKEAGDTATRDSALKSAQTTIDRAASETDAFRRAARFDGQDDALKQQLLDASERLASYLKAASQALRNGDTPAYVTINDKDIRTAGIDYSAAVEKFQKLAGGFAQVSAAGAARDYQWVLGLVLVGVSFSLVLIASTYFALRRIVIGPLHEAVNMLDRIAANDLTVEVPQAGANEIGQLFAAMSRMRSGLWQAVSVVRENCDAIHTAAREISAGNLDLSSRTEQQSASLEETAASMGELTSTVKRNAEHARTASDLAANAAQAAERGGDVVGRAVQTMSAVSTSSQKIADITGLIDSIAFQTNILALNAAVESARAGELGRGFAVVAGEVRSLAQRSAAAAQEIKTLIGTSVEDVKSGNALVTEAGRAMGEIVASVREVASIMTEITAATAEQSLGIEQVGQAVSQMDQVTQQNAALVEQSAAAASALEQQAQATATAVAAFRLSAR
ncbi:methyl-accepting chemotaxis sensory transducer with TarH sensor [Trinickia caryophylli]|uniref:Methyl-accepting chemotaxis sensory transducer with TarH sensor n=2 Tax=Trinickia caryophylli TaxID=28094 RepID=A0A1X7CHN4_TRICW|nr:methyl-accepting chemotaxis sensory transducer with TarH sensor [Trinickia caryophylli]